MSDRTLYPHNILEGFGMGVLLDLRVRLAMELLKSPMFHGRGSDSHLPQEALNHADKLFELAEAQGLMSPWPSDDGELTPELRAQAKRTASFQALQQIEGGKFVQDEQARVVPGMSQLTANMLKRAN